MPYDWAGTRILQQNTALPDKRRVFNNLDTLVPTDLREWVTPGDREELRRALRQMTLPAERSPGTFDARAKEVWRWVTESISYAEDAPNQLLTDFWQFPAETIATGKGDCEDSAFLLASLLLASGISPYCVRVVFGTLEVAGSGPIPHAWTVYKDESGRWCTLESTLDAGMLPEELPSAETSSRAGHRECVYTPILCVNTEHVWEVGSRHEIRDVQGFISEHAQRRGREEKRAEMLSAVQKGA